MAPVPSPPAPDLDLVRRRFLNVVGHALRTPMATLRGQVEVLAATDDSEARDAMVGPLLRSARRLERLLDDVLVAADVTTRLPTDEPTTVRVADTVSAAFAAIDGLPDGAECTIRGATDAVVTASPATLRWLLTQLLDNAARYGEPPVVVDLATTGGGGLKITVSSTGDPLPARDLDHAFELFYRGEAAVIRDGARMGIGLALARQLASHLGATCVLRNREDGRGVTAVLEIDDRG